jgi:hypothetical protein
MRVEVLDGIVQLRVSFAHPAVLKIILVLSKSHR